MLLYAILSAQKLVNAFDTSACRASQAERTVVKMAQSQSQIDQIFSIESFPTAIACQESGVWHGNISYVRTGEKSHVGAQAASRD